MDLLSPIQLSLIALCFVWSGFVRSGMGFGGSVLSLPFLLLILNDPLVFLPIISVQMLFFSAFIGVQSKWHRYRKKRAQYHQGGQGELSCSEHVQGEPTSINWAFLKYAIPIMLVPKIIGVAGLIVLPGELISMLILIIITGYSVSYLLRRPIKSPGGWGDTLLLVMGGYVSGTSLIAAPLVVPVAASRMPPFQLRNTLLMLWFVMVAIKLAAFLASGVDLQLRHHLWLLPCAWIGHVMGERFHRYSLRAGTETFMSYVGGGLMIVSIAGIVDQIRHWL